LAAGTRTEALAPREEFPVLSDLTYLNTASIGLVPMSVQAEAERWDRDIAARGTVALDEEAEIAVFERTREAAGRLLGVSPDDVAILSSATLAMAEIAWWVRPPRGSNVVSIDLEFPSSTFPWFRVAEETGAEVRLVAARDDPASLSFERLAELVDGDTAAICVSHVQFATGHRFDIRQLIELARAHDAVLLLDATQSAGAVPLDGDAAEVDFLVSGSYKWLCAPFGSAFCYLGPRVRERFHPPLVGWRSVVDPYRLDARTVDLAPDARRLEFSTSGYGAAVALGRSIAYLLNLDPARVLEHNLVLAARLISGLDELGAIVLTPRDDRDRSGIVTARFPGRDGEAIAAELNARGVVVSPRFESTRLSVHFFNDEADIDHALETVAAVLGR
jgi:cysteine desulfurase/selenocysteine lyase